MTIKINYWKDFNDLNFRVKIYLFSQISIFLFIHFFILKKYLDLFINIMVFSIKIQSHLSRNSKELKYYKFMSKKVII